ncbi:tip attachment protein [Enterobacter phage ATCEA85]|nr:tip attachment protein [Enterobacter phage ATCEA85]
MEIKGYKGGGGNARTPVEDPDSLVSNATVRMLLALSEGEVEDIPAAELPKRVYLDGTPVENEDGSVNIPGVTVEFRNGSPTQEPIQGFPAVESETRINVALKQPTPWVRQVTNTELDAVRIRMNFRLVIQESDGDRVGGRIEYKIEYRKVGDSAYTEAFNGAVDGKQKDNYERDHRIDLPKSATGWQIRVTRITPDSDADTRVLDSGIVAITEIVDARVRYPWTALLFVSFDAKSFQNIPKVSIKMKGRRVRVPSNYDPETATYNGSWDGTFKQAYTTNPAWHVFDMATHKRYGLGRRIPANFLNKWTMYAIAQRCDELVTNADGTQERRYTSNLYIQKRASAWTVIRDLVSIFNGMVSYGNQQLQIAQDAPAAVRHTVTNDEVVDGKFQYAYGSVENRKGIAHVSYDDPANHYKTNVTVVQRKDLVERYGIEPIELSAIGCVSEYEAQRRGLWALISNTNDRMVSYRVGLDGIKYLIGDVIAVANKYVQGGQFGGRVVKAEGPIVTVDRVIPDNAVPGDKFLCREEGTDGNLIRDIVSISEDRLQLTLSADVKIQAGEVYLLDCAAIAPELFRVTKIVYNEQDANFTVTGLAYSHSKYLEVDTGARIEDRPTTLIPTGQLPAPENIQLEGYSIINQGTRSANLNGTWNPVENAVAYEIQIRRKSQTNGSWSQGWSNLPTQSTTSVDVNGVLAGTYQIRVRAVGRDGQTSVWGESGDEFVDGKRGEIPDVQGLVGEGVVNGITWRWVTGTDDLIDMKSTDLEWRQINDQGVPVGDFVALTNQTYPTGLFTQYGLSFAQKVQVRARFVSSFGDAGPWSDPVIGMASDNMGDYYENIDQAIKDSDTYGELTNDIKDVSEAAQAAQDAADAAGEHADQIAADVVAQGQQISQNAQGLAQEVKDRVAGDAATAQAAADALLNTKNEVEAQIETTNTTMQDGFDSLAQQIASISAGTGEQFDSLKIWYYDKDSEGWSADDGGTNLLPITDDGWLLPAGGSSEMRSPSGTGTLIDGNSYKYIRLRIKKVGTPPWNARLYWIGANEQGWNDSRRLSIPAPDFDPTTGIAAVSIADIPWQASDIIRRIRLDFSQGGGANADNYYAIDWLAVGRPTPGASQAQIQQLQKAITDGDSAEATLRNQLAVQMRGSYDGTNIDSVTSGLMFSEKTARVTADQAITQSVEVLEADYNANKATVTQRLDTLASATEANANAITDLNSKLETVEGDTAANAQAIGALQTKVTDIDGKVTVNSNAITSLNSAMTTAQYQGGNMWIDGSFESYKVGQQLGQDYTAQVSDTAAHVGSKSLWIRRLNGEGGNSDKYLGKQITIRSEGVYRFELWAMMPSGQTLPTSWNVAVGIRTVGATGEGQSWISGLVITSARVTEVGFDKWFKISGKATIPAGSVRSTGQMWISCRGVAGGAGYSMYLDDVTIVDVSDADMVDKKADANASAITGLTTEVTNVKGQITSISQQITQLDNDITSLEGAMKDKADASALATLNNKVTDLDGKVTSQGQALTQLTNSVTQSIADTDSLAEMPGNMVVNHSFERLLETWVISNGGAEAYKAQNPRTGSYILRGTPTTSPTLIQSKATSLKKGRTYRYGAWVRRDAAMTIQGDGSNMKLAIRDTGNQLLASTNLTLTNTPATGTWNNVSGEYTPAADTAARFTFHLFIAGGNFYADDAYLIDVTDEKNITANASATEALTTRVEKTEQGLVSQGQAITNLENSVANVQVGGANLVLNSDFSAAPQASISPATSFLQRSYTTDPSVLNWIVEKDETFTLSVWYQEYSEGFGTDKPFTDFVLGKAVGQTDPWTMRMSARNGVFTKEGNLYRVTVSQTAKKGSTIAAAGNWKLLFQDTTQKTGMKLVRLKLEKGNKATDWTPAVADMATAKALDALTTTVTQQGEDLTAVSQATQKLSAMLQTSNAIMNGDLANNADQWANSGSGSSFSYNAGERAIQTGTDSIRVANTTAIPAEAGLKFTVSIDARVTAEGFTPSSDSMGFIGNLGNPTAWAVSQTGWLKDLTTAYQTKTFELTLPANFTGRYVYLRFASAGAAPSGVRILLRNIVVTTSTGVGQKAEASAVNELTTTVQNIDGRVTANATAINSMKSRVDGAEAAIDGLNETVAENGLAMATGFNQMRAMIGDNSAAITQQNTVIADLEQATAEQINTINSSIGDMSATVQQVSSTVADIDGKLSAQWGVKVQTDTGGNNPRVAGIQLGIDATGSSQFLVQADTFGVYTGGAGKAYPFVVKNGVAYMQSAMIENGSIDNAKIGNMIQSNNYVWQSTGWAINKDGNFSINGNSPGQGRMTLDASGIRFFDANNVQRVTLGLY